MDEEMKSTLYEVARMKAQFELLKNAIMNSLELDYTGEGLKLKDDRLIVCVMETLEPDDMMGILADLKADREKRLKEIKVIKRKTLTDAEVEELNFIRDDVRRIKKELTQMDDTKENDNG